MKQTFLLSIFFFFFLELSSVAQSLSLFGLITDQEGAAIEDASILIDKTPLGTNSDSNGTFRIIVPGKYAINLLVRHIEYKPRVINIDPQNIPDTLYIRLEKDTRILKQVEVLGAKDSEGRDQASVIRLDPQTATVLPSPFNDFNRILATLPGVTSNNELSSNYAVRGGNFDENLVYVNDIPIYRPFLIRAGQQEGLSFVNPELVEGVEFSSGGWQPKYGDKLSSSLNIQYKKPTVNAGSISLGLLGGSGHFEGSTKDNKVNFVLGIRQKSSQYLLNTLETKGEYLPKFTDVQSFVNIDLSGKNQKANTTELGVLFSYARNRYLVLPESRESTFGTIERVLRLYVAFEGQELMNYNSYQSGIKLSHTFSDKFKSFLIASALYTSEREYLDVEGGYRLCDVNNNFGTPGFNECISIKGIGTNFDYARNKLIAQIINIESRSVLELDARNELEFGVGTSIEGVEDFLSEYSFIDSADYVTVDKNIHNELRINTQRLFGFVQHRSLISASQSLTYGVRFNYWSLNNQFLISPRIQYSVKPEWDRNVVFRAAVGFYQQPPFYRELRGFNGDLNFDLKAQSSIHFIGGADYEFEMWGRPFKMLAEAYYKHLYNVIPYDVDNVRLRYYAHNDAKAYAAGMDFRVSGDFIPGSESWFSLGVLTTKEDILKDAQGFIRRPSDQLLNMAIFFQDHIPNDPTLKMNLSLLFGSGLPFGPPNSELKRNSFKGKAYKRVDIGFSKLISYNVLNKAKFLQSLWIGAEILNLLGNNNAISYTWIKDVNSIQYAVPNSLSARFLNMKCVARF